MKNQKFLLGITIKKNNKEKLKLNLPCENKKSDEFFNNIESNNYKSIFIYSNYGVKILDKNIIVGINDNEYYNKNVYDLEYKDFKKFILKLNEKVKKILSKFTYTQITIFSNFISTNIDELLDFSGNGRYTLFEKKSLKEVAFEKEKIQGTEDFELQFLMNSRGYFQVPGAVVKFDLEQVHLEEDILISYLEYIYYNTRFKIKDNKYVCIELPEKTLQLEFNIQEMFDEYMGFEEKDEKNIRKEIECYRETFERKYDLIETDYVLDDYLEYECKHNFIEKNLNDLIYFREDIQKNMLDRIEYYYNNEDWFGDMEPNIDRNKSLKEIQEEIQSSFFKEMIDNFILGEFNMWWEHWTKI